VCSLPGRPETDARSAGKKSPWGWGPGRPGEVGKAGPLGEEHIPMADWPDRTQPGHLHPSVLSAMSTWSTSRTKPAAPGFCASPLLRSCENAARPMWTPPPMSPTMAEGRLQEAYLRHMENNPFPIACSRVCPAFCEKKCSAESMTRPSPSGDQTALPDWAGSRHRVPAPKSPKKRAGGHRGRRSLRLACGVY